MYLKVKCLYTHTKGCHIYLSCDNSELAVFVCVLRGAGAP